jgi:hypothetical protein
VIGWSSKTGKIEEEPKPTVPYPHVAVICPKYLHGEASTAQISNAIGVSAGPEYVNLYTEHRVAREQAYSIKARGQRWLDHTTGGTSIARWVITENSSQGTGVPTDFNCGVLYQHGEKPFKLSVDVRLRTKTGLCLFGRPWSPLKPVVIRPNTKFGRTVAPEGIDEMPIDDWKALCHAEWSANDERCVWLDQ